MQVKTVVLFTDGAYSRSYNIGGYAFLLKYNGHSKTGSGKVENTTSNRMEIMAAIEGLKLIKQSCEVIIYADSTYVVHTINKWIGAFVADPMRANHDLMRELYTEINRHVSVEARWVKGHSGHSENDLVDELARKEAGTYDLKKPKRKNP